MKVHIALDFGGDDPQRPDEAVSVFREGSNGTNNLKNSPRRQDVWDGRNHVVRREPKAVFSDDAQAWRAVYYHEVIAVNDRLERTAENVLGIDLVVSLHRDKGKFFLDFDQLYAGRE